jgi:putative transposase
MKRSKFSEEQFIAILKEHEAGMPTAEVCRRRGISDTTFYKYKAKFGGLEVLEARRLRGLEDENAKLKKLLAEVMLHNVVLKDLTSKNGDARAKREAVAHAREHHGLSKRRACSLVGVSRRAISYQPTRVMTRLEGATT